MYATLKLTLTRLFIITAAIIVTLLATDALKHTLAERQTPADATLSPQEYMLKRGIEIEPTPLYVKETTVDAAGADGWQEYAALLKQKGFDLSSCMGKKIEVSAYRQKGSANSGVRLISCEGKIVAFEPISVF